MSAAVAPTVSTNLPNNPDTAATNSSPMDSKRIESEGELSTRVFSPSLFLPEPPASLNPPYGRDYEQMEKHDGNKRRNTQFFLIYPFCSSSLGVVSVLCDGTATILLYVHHAVLGPAG